MRQRKTLDSGSGSPTIVLVHGICCHAHDWQWHFDAYSKTHHVIAPTLRGHEEDGTTPDDLTIEGLASNGTLHPMQQAFWDEHALQCGYCTPGMIMAGVKLVENNPNLSEAEIRHGLEGNLCRCTGYDNIVKAIKAAAQAMGG